jgi:signal transduction histidine kinase
MMEVPGYRIVRELATSGDFLLLRATREDDGAPVTLKVPEAPHCEARLRHELELTRPLHLDGVLQALALVELPAHGPVLVLEGFGEQTLAQRLAGGGLEPRAACRVALGLIRAVEAMHAAGILHLDLRPASVLLGADGESVKLTGFTLATLRPHSEAEPDRDDARALGMTLHALLGGHGAVPQGDAELAADGYDRAIRWARQHGQPSDDGMAREAAARFHRAEGRERLARAYLEETRACARVLELEHQLVEQEKLATLGSLTAGIVHELQNPLNFVNNFSELSTRLTGELEDALRAAAERLDAQVREDMLELVADLRQNAQRIHTHGRRATDIIRTMLRHARRSEGTRSKTDFNALIRDSMNLAVQGLRGKPGAASVRAESELAPDVGIVELAANDISRVLINLLDNAFYATVQKRQQAGAGFSPLIHVRTRRQGDTVELRVRDNGSGIPEHIREKLFLPFFTTKPSGVGTGLGLSLCHDIVQEHHGDIRVESAPGEYTEFIITLPAP